MAPPPALFILLLKAPLSTPEIIQGILQSPSPPEILEGEREEDDEAGDESGEDDEEDDESDDCHIIEEDADEDMTDEDDIKPSRDTNVRFCRLTSSERDQILAWLQQNHPSHRPLIIRLAAFPTPAQRLTRATDLSRRGLDPTLPQYMPSSANNERSKPRYPGPVIEPTYYFFYGTLAEPAVLRRVLELPDTYQPSYRNAKLLGWRLEEISGGYLALVEEADERVGVVVKGKAWECENEGMARSLALYETGAYEEVGVEVEVEGVGWLWGRTFVGVPGGR